jgi:hypothetical protein
MRWNMPQAVGLGGLRCQLGDELGRGDANRGGEAEALPDATSDFMPDLNRAEKVPLQAADIEKCFVEGQTLDHRGNCSEDFEDLDRGFFVSAVVGRDHQEARAPLFGLHGRHSRVDSEGPRLITRRSDDPSFAGTANHHRTSLEFGLGEAFDLHKEGIHVHVKDRLRKHTGEAIG